MAASRVVVMGVSGCGKSTVGRGLAAALGVPYVEGDELHPPHNVQRMAAGIALTDADREGWLAQVASQLSSPAALREGVVVACSALRRRYRDQLRAAAPDARFVHLHGDVRLLRQRLAQRQGHYMPASLLDSQLQTLEPPDADERAVVLDIAESQQSLVDAALRALRTS
jgi:gluconokinase